MGEPALLCLLNMCGIVGIQLPATLPSILATGATYLYILNIDRTITVYTGMYWYILVCTITYWYVQVHTVYVHT